MASGPITSWQIDGDKVETMTDYFLGLWNHCDSHCSHEIKTHLLLGRKAMTNLDSILKSRDITLLKKVCIVKAMVFPAVMYGCELGTIKKAEPVNWCFWTVVLEKTLESPLDCREIEDRRRRRQQKMRQLDSITNSMAMNLSKLQEMVKDREAWHAADHEVAKSQTRLSNWTITTHSFAPERSTIFSVNLSWVPEGGAISCFKSCSLHRHP